MRIHLVTFLFGLMACFAYSTPPAQAQDNKLPAATLAAFQASPGTALVTYPSGGPEMVNFITRLLASDIELLDEVIGLIESANPAQKAAIGAALGRAAKYYEALAGKAVDDEAKQVALNKAERIAKAVAETGNPIVMASYNIGSGEATAAVAGRQAPAGAATPGGSLGQSASGGNGGTDSSGSGGGSSSGFLSAGSGSSGGGGGGGSSTSPTT
jgi:hypothetical protein